MVTAATAAGGCGYGCGGAGGGCCGGRALLLANETYTLIRMQFLRSGPPFPNLKMTPQPQTKPTWGYYK